MIDGTKKKESITTPPPWKEMITLPIRKALKFWKKP
jgi:hypothetical protein